MGCMSTDPEGTAMSKGGNGCGGQAHLFINIEMSKNTHQGVPIYTLSEAYQK